MSQTAFDLQPYSNYEREKKERKKTEAAFYRDVARVMIEYQRIRDNIFASIVDYVHNQALDDSYVNPLFDGAVAAIQPLEVEENIDNTVLEDRLKTLFQDDYSDTLMLDLTDQERQFLHNTGDLSVVRELLDNGKATKRSALLLVSYIRTQLAYDTFTNDEIVKVNKVLTKNPHLALIMDKNKLTPDDKAIILDVLLRKHSKIYQKIHGKPTPAAIREFEVSKENLEKEIDRLWWDDIDVARDLVDIYYQLLEGHAKQMGKAIEDKYKAKLSKAGRGHPPTEKGMSKTVLKQMVDDLPDSLYKDILKSRVRKNKYMK